MGISRQLPKSDSSRDRALKKALDKQLSILLADRFLTANTDTRLAAIQPSFRALLQARSVALSGQGGSTPVVEQNKITAKMLNSQFLMVFNFGVKRGVYTPAQRAHFGLPINDDSLPEMVTEEQILQVGDNLVAGDASRVAAGGAAMSNPTAAEVAAANTAFRTTNTDQSSLKDAYDQAQEDVEDARPEADAVIKKVWDEVDTFYNEETISSKRRKAREWGVVYVSDVQLTFNFIVQDNGGSPLGNVVCELVDTGATATSNVAGQLQVHTTVTGSATFSFSRADYITQEVTIDIPDGQTEFTQTITLVHV